MHNLELRIPPLIVVAIAAMLMWLIAGYTPEANFAVAGQRFIAIGIATLGVLFCVAGVLEFRRARTTTNPMNPVAASSLVARGIYRYSRNPMYLGFAFFLTGWAVFLGSPLGLLVVVAFVYYLNRFQIVPEEKALGARFGPEFAAYCRKVRRWI